MLHWVGYLPLRLSSLVGRGAGIVLRPCQTKDKVLISGDIMDISDVELTEAPVTMATRPLSNTMVAV